MTYYNNLLLLAFILPILLHGQEVDWETSPSAYEYSMSITCVVVNQDFEYTTDVVLIGVFASDETCVGSGATNTYFPPISANLGFITVFSNQLQENYTLKVLIGEVVYPAGNLAFEANGILGTFDAPLVITPSFAGCTNELALNYNPVALEDDGSCVLINEGCTDQDAFNYEPNANTNDGSCIPKYFGCFNSNYLEYNENANSGVQEDYCLTEISYGCVNDCYVEYDSLANIDNGSCVTSWKAAYISALTNAQEVNVILQIDLIESWNIIGFTKPESIDAAMAFDCILDKLIVVKDNSGNMFLPFYSFNGIGNLIPGMGYQIKITDSVSSFSFCD